MAKVRFTKSFQSLRGVKQGLFILLVMVLLRPAHLLAQAESSLGPLEAISDGLTRLISGITSVNIESATLGIDKGLIGAAVIGLGRSVERNPFATGTHDQFLVKDRMRLGYELGAGFVVAGTVSYVQEWTLVYPVATSLKGTLSRQFLVDLFLPLTVKKIEESQLPQEYALIRESYFEGKGRLKIGGTTPFMVGNQTTLGRVQLTGLITKREKSGDIKIAREYSRFNRFTYELWMNLILFDLPIFDAYINTGKAVRNYISLNNKTIKPQGRIELLKALFKGNDEETLNNYLENESVHRRVESDFRESYNGINLFYLFEKETFTREDYVTDTIFLDSSLENESINEVVNHWWQYLDRHYHEWTTGLQSELYRSDVFLSGKPIKNSKSVITRIERPQLRLKLKVNDEKTTKKEYESDFQHLTKNLSSSGTLGLEAPVPYPQEPPHTLFTLEIHFDEDHLNQLKRIGEKIWYEALEKKTGKPALYWKRAAQSGYHSRERGRLRQARLSFNDIHLAKKTKTIVRYLEKAREHEHNKPTLSLRYLSWALRQMFGVGKSSWDTRMLEALKLKLTRPYFLTAKVEVYNDQQIEKIHRFATSEGFSQWNNRPEYNFLLKDPSEIYFFFEQHSFL